MEVINTLHPVTTQQEHPSHQNTVRERDVVYHMHTVPEIHFVHLEKNRCGTQEDVFKKLFFLFLQFIRENVTETKHCAIFHQQKHHILIKSCV